ncbi:spermidine/putrescine ABC transporter permease PotC [Candidatus Purcelliella pentastirinorum]|uniref:Spermidine/putrescine transport system permease protein PotC n=1 Tax=Candidatus Purcelliella pentastirinorum TaxID=472834 RepID=A0AAX3N8G3_9ENTR|nr:spermidine/putrescine ABC transporter permease PotC [Candidatus Purcelliella pentastirinorum]WDI78754.1 spermidine/putrescine ABC transporter permease PotC [Candidatus Purcelliella pentastirinorum]WDR80727.1 spermidine/putrescine ABC transporter permease PotC [Candidatus Purcelliella pentastirinorum]
MMNNFLKNSFILIIYCWLYIPIIILITNSFNKSKFGINWEEFSLKWYTILANNNSLIEATKYSLIIGILSATIATIMGLIIAIVIYYQNNYFKSFITTMLFIIIISPDIVMAISLLLFFTLFNISLGFWSLLFSHITFSLPFTTITIYSRLNGFDNKILEAARDLGANIIIIIYKIIIPIAIPGIVAGWLLSFTLSIDDVVISFFVSSPQFEVLPIKIFSMVKLGISPEINALGTILLSTTIILAGISQLLLYKKGILNE